MPAFAALGLLALLLHPLAFVFAIIPAVAVALLLFGPSSSHSAFPDLLSLATVLGGLAVLAVLVSLPLRFTHWPRPVGTSLLMCVALIPAPIQPVLLSMWFSGERGEALGVEIAPAPLNVLAPGVAPAGYLHLAAVVLTLFAVQLWTGARVRVRARVRSGVLGRGSSDARAEVVHRREQASGADSPDTVDSKSGGPRLPADAPCPEPAAPPGGDPTAGPRTHGTGPAPETGPAASAMDVSGPEGRRPSRTGLVLASAALAATLPVSTAYSLERLRDDTAQQIRSDAASIGEYPYPLAVLDAPGWRPWHLGFHHEHRSFTATYINDEGVQILLITKPEHDLAHECSALSPGAGATDTSATDTGTEGTGGLTSEGDGPVCAQERVEVSGLNGGASAFEAFEARTVVYDVPEESMSEYAPAPVRVDLGGAGSEGYAEVAAATADEGTGAPASGSPEGEGETGPVVLLQSAYDPDESFLQGRTRFDIPASTMREAAGHVRLLDPGDSAAAQELASTAHLAR